MYVCVHKFPSQVLRMLRNGEKKKQLNEPHNLLSLFELEKKFPGGVNTEFFH